MIAVRTTTTPRANRHVFAFAPEHMDNFYCATCAEQQADPTNNPAFNLHFVGSRGSIQYMDLGARRLRR